MDNGGEEKKEGRKNQSFSPVKSTTSTRTRGELASAFSLIVPEPIQLVHPRTKRGEN
jgi:hypothetical protein